MQHRACSRLFATLFIVFAAASLAIAQNNPAPSAPKPEVKNLPDAPADSTTEGSLKAGGQTIEYRAIAGTLTVGSTDPQDAMIGFDGKYLPDATIDLTAKPEDRPATARFFYAAYFQKNPAKNRPITFLYNGGPGSATMYLHMGAFGPMRLVLPQDSAAPGRRALPDRSQRVQPSRCQRPRLHRRARYRLQPNLRQRRIEGLLRNRSRRACLRPLHPPIPFEVRSLELPEISLRRKLWHHSQRHSHKPASAPPRSQRIHLPLANPQL